MRKRRGSRDFAIIQNNPPPPPGETRDPLQWPFAQNSIWNMPIGTGAVFVAANLTRPVDPNDATGSNFAPFPFADNELICLTPTAPLRTIGYSSAAWTGACRCDSTGSGAGFPKVVPIPDAWIVPHGNKNNSSAILAADGDTIREQQPFTRCPDSATRCSGGTTGNPTNPTSFDSSPDKSIRTSDGISGSHGGSHMSALGGAIRLGELRNDTNNMRHAIKCALFAAQFLYNGATNADCFRWPASSADSYAATKYGTTSNATNATNTNMKLGALLAIPSTTNITTMGLETVPAQKLAWTLQNYGCYVVDDNFGAGWLWNVETGFHTNAQGQSKLQEFQTDWGFAFEQRVNNGSLTTPWTRDTLKLIEALRCVSNNSPSTIGGGGAPLQPLAPPFA